MEAIPHPESEQILSAMNICRNYLYMNDIITSDESAEIGKRIRRFADENNVELTCTVASRAKIVCGPYSYEIEQ